MRVWQRCLLANWLIRCLVHSQAGLLGPLSPPCKHTQPAGSTGSATLLQPIRELMFDWIMFRWSIIWFRWSIIWPKQFRLQMPLPPYRPKQTVSAKLHHFRPKTTLSAETVAFLLHTLLVQFPVRRVRELIVTGKIIMYLPAQVEVLFGQITSVSAENYSFSRNSSISVAHSASTGLVNHL